jgi:hypothetical protein
MQINMLGLGIFVTYDVLLEHKSMGTFSDEYRANLDIFHQKWKKQLPMVRGMMMTTEDVEEATAHAKSYFEGRMTDDKVKIELRHILSHHRGNSRKLTKQEKKRIDKSAYRCRRANLKNSDVSTSEAWSSVKDYVRSPYATKRGRLLSKFLWYKVIRHKH